MRALETVTLALAAAWIWHSAAEAAEVRIDDFAFACTTPDGQTLKPKFGDIKGVFYTDLPGQREQCLEAIKRKIALCRQNVGFESNSKNEKHAACLPIFEQQARSCVGHFEFGRGKCDAGGPSTNEAGTQAKQAAEPEDAYTVSPLDKGMEVAKRANVRAGPGPGHAVLGTLDAGTGVRVTGEVQERDWLRVDLREDGGAAFIHASLLKEREAGAALKPFGPNWSIVINQSCQVWNHGAGDKFEPFTWSGGCVDGKASGQGRMTAKDGEHVYEGSMLASKRHGHGADTEGVGTAGASYEGEYRDGRGTYTYASGRSKTCEWRDGESVDGSCTYHK